MKTALSCLLISLLLLPALRPAAEYPFQGYIAGHTIEVAALSPDGSLLALSAWPNNIHSSRNRNYEIMVYKIDEVGKLATLSGHRDIVSAIAFNKDGTLLAAGLGNGYIHLWDIQTQTCIAILKEHNNFICSIAFCPHDESKIISASKRGQLFMWDLTTREIERILFQTKEPDYWCNFPIALHPTQPLLAATWRGGLWLFNLADETHEEWISGDTPNLANVSSMAFDSDGMHLHLSTRVGTEHIWARDEKSQCFSLMDVRPFELSMKTLWPHPIYTLQDGLLRILMRTNTGIAFADEKDIILLSREYACCKRLSDDGSALFVAQRKAKNQDVHWFVKTLS